MTEDHDYPCEHCGGTGRNWQDTPCRPCQGTGERTDPAR